MIDNDGMVSPQVDRRAAPETATGDYLVDQDEVAQGQRLIGDVPGPDLVDKVTLEREPDLETVPIRRFPVVPAPPDEGGMVAAGDNVQALEGENRTVTLPPLERVPQASVSERDQAIPPIVAGRQGPDLAPG